MLKNQKLDQIIPQVHDQILERMADLISEEQQITNQFYKDLGKCSYVKIKNLASQKYLTQNLNSRYTSCNSITLKNDVEQIDQESQDMFKIISNGGNFIQIQGAFNGLDIFANKQSTNLGCISSDKQKDNKFNKQNIYTTLFSIASANNADEMNDDLTQESWFIQANFKPAQQLNQDNDDISFEVNEKFIGTSLGGDEGVQALIAMETLEEIKKYSLVSSDLDVNKWKFECYIDEEQSQSDEDIEVESDYAQYDSDDLDSDEYDSEFSNSDDEYFQDSDMSSQYYTAQSEDDQDYDQNSMDDYQFYDFEQDDELNQFQE